MFNEDGSWKEFGIYNSEKHTWFPVWLFCIIWAILSYGLIKFTIGHRSKKLPTVTETVPQARATKLKPGYYALNRNTLESEGVPRYVYIGEEVPEV